MRKKNFLKKIFLKLFNIYKANAQIIVVIFGFKIKFDYPLLKHIEDMCFIPKLDELLDKNTFFPHPIGIVINGNVKFGNNCTIYQNVTIGDSLSGSNDDRYPIVGNNVIFCANSVAVGNITIGDNVIIGAGAVVVKNIPSNVTVAGNPAKIIKTHKI